MKTLKIKTLTITLAVMATVSFSSVIIAEDVVLPVISRPAVLQEGTQTVLTPAQIAELLPWAKNSKVFLVDLLEGVQGSLSADKADRLIDGIKSVVGESAPKNSELLMRYVLNRGLVLNDALIKEMNVDDVGAIDARVRVLTSSIKMAIKYYDNDMKVLSNQGKSSFASFGVDYFNFLNELNKSIFDASAQYKIQRISLEWLQWDLYRDLNNASFAPQIVKINNSLKIFPDKKLSDAQSIVYIRQIKQISQQLNVNSLRNGGAQIQVNNDVEDSQVSTEINNNTSLSNDLKKFSNPKVAGMPISMNSNFTGACRALGYERAANSAAEKDGAVRGMLLSFNANGKLIATEVATDQAGFGIKELVCLNKMSSTDSEAIYSVKTPKFGEIYMSTKSDVNGVCNVLGYERGVNGSIVNDGATRGSMVIVDRNSKIDNGELATDRDGFSIKEIVCVNKRSPTSTVLAAKIKSPALEGARISITSDPGGVCKALGYRGATSNSLYKDNQNRGTMIVIGSNGRITGTEVADENSGFGILEMICWK